MKRLLAALSATTLLALTMVVLTAKPAEAAISPCTDGTTQLPSGTQTAQYVNKTPAEDRSFDGPSTTFTPNSASNSDGPEIGEDVLRNRLCLGRYIVKNLVDPDYQLTWRQWHDDIGGHGTQVFAKSINVGDIYIHGGEDGIKLQNCAEGNPPAGSNDCRVQQPGGSWAVSDVAIRNHHDDALDNDDCMPGTLNNALIEGHTGISTQEESSSTGPCQSSGEGDINVVNSIIRTMPVSAFDGGAEDDFHGGGRWFKWDHNENTAEDHHTLNLTNVALVVDQTPRSGWDSLDLPGQGDRPGATTWSGANNFILYLNMQGQPYGGPMPGQGGVPTSVEFLSGTAARAKFRDLRDDWLEAHGCDRRPDGDINPKNDPVCRVTSPK